MSISANIPADSGNLSRNDLQFNYYERVAFDGIDKTHACYKDQSNPPPSIIEFFGDVYANFGAHSKEFFAGFFEKRVKWMGATCATAAQTIGIVARLVTNIFMVVLGQSSHALGNVLRLTSPMENLNFRESISEFPELTQAVIRGIGLTANSMVGIAVPLLSVYIEKIRLKSNESAAVPATPVD